MSTMIISSRFSHQARVLARHYCHRSPASTNNALIPVSRMRRFEVGLANVISRPIFSNANATNATNNATGGASSISSISLLVAATATLLCTTTTTGANNNIFSSSSTAKYESNESKFSKQVQCSAGSFGGDPVMIAPVTEPATGKMFPRLCNGMTLAGCGVRVKWGFVKVYAVGTYLDPLAMSMVKNQGESAVKKALLDPKYPRTIRIVMNRNLSVDKYTSAIIEALEPRMADNPDLSSLEEFKKLNPKVDLVDGAEMEMTIRGDVMLYKNATGGLGQIRSLDFTTAMCDVFYGEEAVSPTHLKSVVGGVPNL
mmetsp:Transcript_36673/g.79174  ORF Transcript_36673/g.79174 Transcript_36673/m.79174 type:complete len:313 (-) Transcript_36673:389-1327(-)